MSTKYKTFDSVPTSVLCDRLDELSNAVAVGKDAVLREFNMSIPAEADRDADIVLALAAQRLRGFTISAPEPSEKTDESCTTD